MSERRHGDAAEQLARSFKRAMAAVRRLRGRETHRPGELTDAQYSLLFCLRDQDADVRPRPGRCRRPQPRQRDRDARGARGRRPGRAPSAPSATGASCSPRSPSAGAGWSRSGARASSRAGAPHWRSSARRSWWQAATVLDRLRAVRRDRDEKAGAAHRGALGAGPETARRGAGCLARVADRRTGASASSVASANVTVAGSRIGLRKATATVNASGQPRSERGQAAGLRPHPVGDRRREAEQPRRQGVDVDRVQVARDRAVAAAEVAGQLQVAVGTFRTRGARRRRGGRVAAAAGEVGASVSSHTSSSPTRASVRSVNLPPARVGLQRRRPHAQRQPLAGPDRPVLGDLVGDVHRARSPGTGKRRIGHQRQVKREGQHVRIGGGQLVPSVEAAHSVIRGQPAAVDRHVVQAPGRRRGRRRRRPPTNGSLEAPGTIRQRRPARTAGPSPGTQLRRRSLTPLKLPAGSARTPARPGR